MSRIARALPRVGRGIGVSLALAPLTWSAAAVCLGLGLCLPVHPGIGWAAAAVLALLALPCWRLHRRGALALWVTAAALLSGIASDRHHQRELRLVLTASREQPRDGWWLRIDELASRQAGLSGKRVFATLAEPDLPPLRVAVDCGQPLRVGTLARIGGALRLVRPASNPGGFDRQRWLATRSIDLELTGNLRQQGPAETGRDWLARLRLWLVERLLADLPQDSARDILPGLVLGLSGGVDPALNDSFRHSGALHLFAVSGLHVSLIGLLFLGLLRPLPRPMRWTAVLLILTLFTLITGVRPSSLRALVMFAVLGVGLLRSRPHGALNALGCACLLELAFHPHSLNDPGFQFSYLVVFGLLSIATPLQRRLFAHPRFQRDPLLPAVLEGRRARWHRATRRFLVSSALVSTLAWACSLPVQIGRFGLWNPAAPFVNFILVPASSLALCLAVLGLLASLPGPAVGRPLRRLAHWLCSLLIWVAQLGDRHGPHAYLDRDPPRHIRLTVLSLQHGSAQLLEYRSRRILIDCGRAGDYPWELRNFLRYRGVEHLDLLVLSHADSAHAGGAEPLLGEIGVGRILVGPDPGRSAALARALAAAEARQVAVTRASAGFRADFDGASLSVLHPPPGFAASRADDNSLCLLFEAEGQRWLFTADAGWNAEAELAMRPELEGGVDVVIRGHNEDTGSGQPALWLRLLAGADAAHPLWILAAEDPGGSSSPLSNEAERGPKALRSFETFPHGALILEHGNGRSTLRGWRDGLSEIRPDRNDRP